MKRTAVTVAALLIAGFMLVTGLSEVQGGSSPFKGQIRILTKMPKSWYSSAGAFNSFIRSHSTQKVYEAGNDKTWEFNIMAFFKKGLGDNEVTLAFYDLGLGSKYVDSQTKMTKDYNSDTLMCSVRLTRPPFDANKKYEVVAQDKNGSKLARGIFTTQGTAQAAIDQQKRYDTMQKEMEASMKELERKAKEQEEAQKKQNEKENKKAADGLF
jgi:hypothetical protein